MVNEIIPDRARAVLVLTGLGSGNATGEGLRSKIDSIALNEHVFAPDGEMFNDATGASLPPLGWSWSIHWYHMDGAHHPRTSDDALVQMIQTVPMMGHDRGERRHQSGSQDLVV